MWWFFMVVVFYFKVIFASYTSMSINPRQHPNYYFFVSDTVENSLIGAGDNERLVRGVLATRGQARNVQDITNGIVCLTRLLGCLRDDFTAHITIIVGSAVLRT